MVYAYTAELQALHPEKSTSLPAEGAIPAFTLISGHHDCSTEKTQFQSVVNARSHRATRLVAISIVAFMAATGIGIHQRYPTVGVTAMAAESETTAPLQPSAETLIQWGDDDYNRKSYTDAMHWYRQAADLGNAEAQAKIGLLYNSGVGSPDYDQSLIWLRKAADQGTPRAQLALAEAYGPAETLVGRLFYYGRRSLASCLRRFPSSAAPRR